MEKSAAKSTLSKNNACPKWTRHLTLSRMIFRTVFDIRGRGRGQQCCVSTGNADASKMVPKESKRGPRGAPATLHREGDNR